MPVTDGRRVHVVYEAVCGGVGGGGHTRSIYTVYAFFILYTCTHCNTLYIVYTLLLYNDEGMAWRH